VVLPLNPSGGLSFLEPTPLVSLPLHSKQAVWEAAIICLRPLQLTFDLLTLKVMSESRVTGATSVPILVFLGHSILDLGPL